VFVVAVAITATITTGQAMAFKSNYVRSAQALVFAASAAIAVSAFADGASAQALSYAPQSSGLFSTDDVMANPPAQPGIVEDDSADSSSVLPERLRRAVVAYSSHEAPGTVIIDTGHTTLYYVLGDNRAIRYGVGVGRQGFTWSGVQTISRKAEWPDWHPPVEMIARQPYLPRFMAGGPGNPLGARAMYLGSSEYRIHGTNDPTTIGKFVSSGCIRLTNEDVEDLFSRVNVGAKVIVLPKNGTQRFEASNKRPGATASRNPEPTSHTATATRAPERQAMNLATSAIY
jgi:lipoprotein-anchoring transpeptidase ErfK/SrfK